MSPPAVWMLRRSARLSTRLGARLPDAPRLSLPTVSARCASHIILSSSTAGASLSKAPTKSSWPETADTLIFINFKCLPTSLESLLPLTKVENYDDHKMPLHSHSPHLCVFDRNGSSGHKNRKGGRRSTRRPRRPGCKCCADYSGGRRAPHHDNRRRR